jgi:hypothetical protein
MQFEEVPQVLISGYPFPLYVRNPDEVVRQINDVKTNRTTSSMMTAPKRIFVSMHSNPTDFKIVMLKGSMATHWNSFLEEARDALGIPPDKAGCIQVTLDQTTVTVKGASELEAGDKVVLRYC